MSAEARLVDLSTGALLWSGRATASNDEGNNNSGGLVGMLVTAIDNGPMAESLMDTGLVQHLMADGFTFKPKQPVDWMVCDIVEKPARTAAMVETWIGDGHCREAVVNLKLPMKQRYAEVRRLLQRLEDGFAARKIKVSIACKQLYHDREEVTCHLRRLGK